MANMDDTNCHGTSTQLIIMAGATPIDHPDPIGWTPQSQSPTTLHEFRKFPTELRLKIWEGVIPGPRVVEVQIMGHPRIAYSTCPTPALLHACLESREVMKKRYDQLILRPLTLQGPGLTYTWIDYSRDTLYLSPGLGHSFSYYNLCILEFLQQIVRLSIRPPMLQNVALDARNIVPAPMDTTLCLFPDLKNIMMVFGDPGLNHGKQWGYRRFMEGYVERQVDDKTLFRWSGRGAQHNAYINGLFANLIKPFIMSLPTGMSRAALSQLDIIGVDIERGWSKILDVQQASTAII